MPHRGAIPALRRHKASGQGVVTLSGEDHYLGAWPEGQRKAPPAVRENYDALLSRWIANGRGPLGRAEGNHGLTVGELLVRFWAWAEKRYPDGSELGNYRSALRYAAERFAALPVERFGPLALKECRAAMIADGLTRQGINRRVGRIVRLFKWGTGEELVPESVWRSLTAVEGIRKGDTNAAEAAPVRPVEDAAVEATLPHLPAEVAAMARFQRLTGARPGEVCSLLASEIEREGPVWVIRKAAHKTAHRGKARVIAVGPQAQAILLPLLRIRCPCCHIEDRAGRLAWRGTLCGPCADRQDEAGVQGPWPALPVEGDYRVFSPAESRRDRFAAMRAARKTKVQPSQRDRSKKRAQRRPGACYDVRGYNRAVARACLAAGVAPWHLNQLRHAHATEVRKLFGLEAAQAALGHSRADVTQIYAERDLALAARVAAAIG